MKIKLSLLLSFFLLISLANAGVIVLEGTYQGKNLYVQNPFAGSGVGFCVYEVTVNGQVSTDEIQSSAFEIDFRNFQLKRGDKIEVKIKHKDDCKTPRILNPEVLKPKSSFDVTDMRVEKDGTLKWTTKGEQGRLPYIVEQFRWNKWIKVGEVEGNGTSNMNQYSFKISPHSGRNQFRIKQIDYTSLPRLSKTVDYNSDLPEVEFVAPKKATAIDFFVKGNSSQAAETMYEVYDQYGNIVKKGYGKQIDISNLSKGTYYVNFDNKMAEFVKK